MSGTAGQVIAGRYRLVDKLGSGGFGRIWRATDETLGVDVAIKEVWLPPAMSPEEHAERLRRAEREARNAVKLRDQPNVVTVHDVVIDHDAPWIIMQLVDGVSLDQQVRQHGPIPAERVIEIARALLRALGAAHAAGVVHRDVKPGNVLLAATGEVLLTDFGIAVHETDPTITATGALVGSMEYMAPERWNGRSIDGASDLFSLGVTLYQAAEGTSPFHRDTVAETLAAVLNHQVPRSTRASAPLAVLIEKLLAKDPKDRPSVAEALGVLDGEATTITPARPRADTRVFTKENPRRKADPTTPAAKKPSPSEGTRAFVIVVLAVLIVVGVYGLVQVTTGKADYFVHDLAADLIFCGGFSAVLGGEVMSDVTGGRVVSGYLSAIAAAAGIFAFAGVMPFVVTELPKMGIALSGQWPAIVSMAIICAVSLGCVTMLERSRKKAA